MSKTLDNLKVLSNINNPFSPELHTQSEFSPKREMDVDAKINKDEELEFERLMSDINRNADETDYIFDSIGDYDENQRVKSGLISLGRKYARRNEDDGTVTEVDKAFNPQIDKLNDLLVEVTRDTEEVEKDINQIRRMVNGRNYQRMNELIETKATLHNTTLSIIKELSSIEKNKFDIKSKLNKDKNDIDPNAASGSILQSIFGVGHDALLSSVDGREGSSGAITYESQSYEDTDQYGESIYSKNFPEDEEDSEGDLFIKYENRGIELVLEESENGDKRIYAQDADGNIVDDYPLPKDINALTFDINVRTGVATDQLQRKYKYISV